MENIITDNGVAIEMLRDVSEILNSIEHNDDNYIEIQIKKLKDNIALFEKVFYQNKADGIYD